MPAMASALALLDENRIRRQKTLVPELDRLFKQLTAEQTEFWDEMAKPKASRRAGAGRRNIRIQPSVARRRSTRLSGVLAADVNHQDATIDQLLAIKQMAWLLRNTAGEASLIDLERARRRKDLAGSPADLHQIHRRHRAAWNALELTAAGMQLPPELAEAMASTKTAYFEQDYLEPARPAAEGVDHGRKGRNDREPVEPDHGRPHGHRRRCRRSRARCRPRAQRDAVFRGDALAGAATRRCWLARSP